MGSIDEEDIAAIFCSRGTKVVKDDQRKTLAVNSGPPSRRFPGADNPPVRPEHYQSHVEVFRNQHPPRHALPVLPVHPAHPAQPPHAGRGRIPSTHSSVDVRNFNLSNQPQHFMPPHLRHQLPERPPPGVIPLRSMNLGGNPNVANRLSIPPLMMLPPNHPHAVSMSPRKTDNQKPLPAIPTYPPPPGQ